eukprot:1094730-Ditylum_brightwellii.AAC.1
MQSLPLHTYNIATIQESKGGLGMYDPTRGAITSFVVPLTRSICYASHGVDISKHKGPLSLYNWQIFMDWETSDLPLL